ncbi:coil containing protein [Vibrio phage 1.193.O._10N.286.52.C6]|nr:coil containing protein [Vibrio phage 1.193.O._10N.286.52.C6]
MKIMTLQEAESEMYFNDGLVTPLSDHAQDAVNRGMDEYFSPMTCDASGEVMPHGMSMNDLDSPMDAEGIEQDLKLWSARL